MTPRQREQKTNKKETEKQHGYVLSTFSKRIFKYVLKNSLSTKPAINLCYVTHISLMRASKYAGKESLIYKRERTSSTLKSRH